MVRKLKDYTPFYTKPHPLTVKEIQDKLSTDDGFLDVSWLLENEHSIQYLTSARSQGKTYSYLDYSVRMCINTIAESLKSTQNAALDGAVEVNATEGQKTQTISYFRAVECSSIFGIFARDLATAIRGTKDEFYKTVKRYENEIRKQMPAYNITKIEASTRMSSMVYTLSVEISYLDDNSNRDRTIVLTFGKIFSISNYMSYRGPGYANVKYVIFDEFQHREGKYLEDEIDGVDDLLSTIFRNRPRKMLALSNPYDIYNPYAAKFNIEQDPLKYNANISYSTINDAEAAVFYLISVGDEGERTKKFLQQNASEATAKNIQTDVRGLYYTEADYNDIAKTRNETTPPTLIRKDGRYYALYEESDNLICQYLPERENVYEVSKEWTNKIIHHPYNALLTYDIKNWIKNNVLNPELYEMIKDKDALYDQTMADRINFNTRGRFAKEYPIIYEYYKNYSELYDSERVVIYTNTPIENPTEEAYNSQLFKDLTNLAYSNRLKYNNGLTRYYMRHNVKTTSLEYIDILEEN